MKSIQFTASLALTFTLLITGCSDPADSVHKTSGGEAEALAAIATETKRFVIQTDSTIGFVGSKVTGSHEGGFKEFEGAIVTADGKPAVGTEIVIQMASTWSDNGRLTGHLKSPDFFNVDEHPESRFTITAVEPADVGYNVTANLDLHGVTKSISFPATITVSDDSVTVTAEFAINREDFGINYPGKTDDLIRDNVVIKLNITAAPEEA